MAGEQDLIFSSKIKYDGVFSFKDFYKFCYDWLNEEIGFTEIKESSAEEMEHAIVNADIPSKTFIKEPIFEHLKEIFGKDVEILINY